MDKIQVEVGFVIEEMQKQLSQKCYELALANARIKQFEMQHHNIEFEDDQEEVKEEVKNGDRNTSTQKRSKTAD